MRLKARTDENHGLIVETFRSVPGCRVLDTSRVGGGFPDTMVLFRQKILLVEIKDGSKPPSKRKLTPAQIKFHAEWPCHIAEIVDDVWGILGI